jgi:hypothetical protein
MEKGRKTPRQLPTSLHGLAARRGVPVEQMRAEILADVERALAWWREAQANQA